MTKGQLRFLLAKAAPAPVDPDLLDAWIDDRYTEILDRLNWKRVEIEGVFQTTAPYSDGTVAVTAGSDIVTLAGGTFDTLMTGLSFRVTGENDRYEFARTDDTHGTLDRTYEGADAAAAGYSIFQSVYQLPPAVRQVKQLTALDGSPGLKFLSLAQLNLSAPARTATAKPRVWAPYMDSYTEPPVIQVELYPVPDAAYAIGYSAIAEDGPPVGSSASLLAWVRPAALKAGVMADILGQLGNLAGQASYEALFEKRVAGIVRNEVQAIQPKPLRTASRYSRHRLQRLINTSPSNIRL